jgi:hypothetical protein
MRRATILAVVIAALASIPTALADSPSFDLKHGNTAISGISSTGSITVNFRETGLGNTPNPVNYELSADADALYACQNGGGNFPSDPKKQSVTSKVSTDGVFNPKNGAVTGSLTLNPPASTLNCPGGQHPVLASITYSNVMICDTDHDVCVTFPGPFSRTFFTV